MLITILTRRATLIALAAFATTLAGCTAAPVDTGSAIERGVILKRTYDFKEAGKAMEYALYVPTAYNKRKATPLVILLHGLTSTPQQVIKYEGIVTEAEKRGYIVAAPFGYNTAAWYGSRGQGKDLRLPGGSGSRSPAAPDNLGQLSEIDVLNVLNLMRKEFKIDAKRTYLMGHSMGGGGTLYLGMKYPDNWAALAAMSPAIYSDPSEIEKIRKTPIIIVQGDDDKLVAVTETRKWVAKMQELKMSTKYIEIKGGDHVQSISRNPQMIGEVFDFLDKQRKR